MNVVLERIQSAMHPHFDGLFSLYHESFPSEERRDLKELDGLLVEPRMFFSSVMAENILAGLVVYWQFKEFLYVEHLAIFADQRRNGVGAEVLRILQNFSYPILLEVEIPYDEASTNRVTFYHNAGFHSLPVEYFQPPYRKGESLLPMMLYSDRADWDGAVLQRSIKLFHWEVYRFGSELK